MSGTCLLVVTDGRKEYIKQTIPSALAQLRGEITRRIIHDDSGDRAHREWLRMTFPTFEVIHPGQRRQGFGGAIRQAWGFLQQEVKEPWVFSLEDDFLFNEEINLSDIQQVMLRFPHIIQMTLKRQPWNEAECIAGGIVEQDLQNFHGQQLDSWTWTEHRKYYSTNPSLFRRSLVNLGWPSGPRSEGRFTAKCLNVMPDGVFGIWKSPTHPPLVEHIGYTRVGHGY